MEYNDNFHPSDSNDFDMVPNGGHELDQMKQLDKGYNKIFRMLPRGDKLKKTKVEFYTSSSGMGCHIRDAETGMYYNSLVGSANEDLYFKVGVSTGECTSKNGSTTLFYISPQQYMSHHCCTIDPKKIEMWENRRTARLEQLEHLKNVKLHKSKTVIV